MRLASTKSSLDRVQRLIRIGSYLLFSSVLWQACTTKAASPTARKGEGGVPVTITQVVQKDVPVDIQAVGNVEAYSTVSIRSQVSGELTNAHFREGDFVKKGEQLFNIDPRLLEAQLNEAQSNLTKAEAQLAQAEATLTRDIAQEKYLQSEAIRYNSLYEHGLISKEQAEQVQSNAEAAAAASGADRAAVQSARAAVEAGKAAVQNSKVTVGYTTIFSPIDGRTGNLNVKQGNVVTANSMELMTINQVQPIYVTFAVPEARLPAIKKSLPVMVSTQDGSAQLERGEITFIDNAVDTTTGTIKLKGTFANAEHKLWPGEFVRVTVRLATQPNALVVPNQVVQTGQEGSYVFVVKPDRTVETRPVVPGNRVDQELVIEKGLEAGETVVLEGQLRLAPGSRVQITTPGGGSPRNKTRS